MNSAGKVLAIGADHAGFDLKEQLKVALGSSGIVFVDLGTESADRPRDYPDVAHAMASGIERGEYARGVLICGSGVGMSMAANRHAGVRAVVCTESYSAAMARRHNDANVLCLGARVIGSGQAEHVLRAFLEAEFEGGRHTPRVQKIERA